MGIGEIRKKDPLGVEFVIRSMLHRLKEEEKARKKHEAEMKRKSKRRHR